MQESTFLYKILHELQFLSHIFFMILRLNTSFCTQLGNFFTINTKIRKRCESVSIKTIHSKLQNCIHKQESNYYHVHSSDTVKILVTFINRICHDKYVLRKR